MTRKKKNPRFDRPPKPKKEKWYSFIAYNGTERLGSVIQSFKTKTEAKIFAKNNLGSLWKGHILVTSIVMDGPFNKITQASNIQGMLPPPN